MLEIDRLYGSIQQAWSTEVGGELVALYMLKRIVFDERMRGLQPVREPIHPQRS
ncbi:hypothetical protein [Pseudomonas antarctica]|uniref:hypothetical protein n=1 Tax=Pseudomonas antarctica TaxID=219572 RepID=UPI001428A817|nr:hypothetical protein [Pseudomonas antarctica]